MKEVDFINSFFEEIRQPILNLYKKRTEIESSTKTDPTDYLTKADLFVQSSFLERLYKYFPEDRLVGEESGFSDYSESMRGRTWLIDPIDGTANFLRGYFPIFCVGIAFSIGSEVVVSGVLVPTSGEIYLAEKGSGAYKNDGTKIKVSNTSTLEGSCVQVDFGRRASRQDRLSYIVPTILSSGLVRCFGSAIMSFLIVAVGSSDGYVHDTLKPWDMAPGLLLVEEAGGRATQVDGSPINIFGENRGIIVTNGLIHDELLSRINEYMKRNMK